jgi:adenylate kinase family enzyme
MGKTTTEFPTWFPSLIKRVREEGTQIPIFKKAEVYFKQKQNLINYKKKEQKIFTIVIK